MKFLSAIALSIFATLATADENSLSWPATVTNSKGEEVFTVDCHTKDGGPTVTFTRPNEKEPNSISAVSRKEDCQGDFARRTLSQIGEMVKADVLK